MQTIPQLDSPAHGGRSRVTPAGPLRYHRQLKGLTQVELAELTGVSREQIINLELGYCQPQYTTAVALALALGCGLLDIFPLSNDEGAPARARLRHYTQPTVTADVHTG